MSLRHQSIALLYRPSTNKVIWTSAGLTNRPHDVNILNDGRISIFNNNSKTYFDGDRADGVNEILIYDFEKDAYETYLGPKVLEHQIKRITGGRAQILPDGHMYVEETDFGRIMFFMRLVT